jgi:hypothetical protein
MWTGTAKRIMQYVIGSWKVREGVSRRDEEKRR